MQHQRAERRRPLPGHGEHDGRRRGLHGRGSVWLTLRHNCVYWTCGVQEDGCHARLLAAERRALADLRPLRLPRPPGRHRPARDRRRRPDRHRLLDGGAGRGGLAGALVSRGAGRARDLLFRLHHWRNGKLEQGHPAAWQWLCVGEPLLRVVLDDAYGPLVPCCGPDLFDHGRRDIHRLDPRIEDERQVQFPGHNHRQRGHVRRQERYARLEVHSHVRA
mmetsp:Transcript_68313/g.193533  ORF Transcript_68313/g.193533 Transcript_68313/m.193533 type:complete len:219 (+) Transcript_68313:975-1631(+)